MTPTAPLPPATTHRPVGWWRTIAKYSLGLAPVVFVWVILVLWLSKLLEEKANVTEVADRAMMQEWLEEARPNTSTLPVLAREYVDCRRDAARHGADWNQKLQLKRREIREQLRALAEPTRAYESKLPAFPVIYRIAVHLGPDEPVVWENPMPRPRKQNLTKIGSLTFYPGWNANGDEETSVCITCEYSLHAFNKLQRDEQDQKRVANISQAVLIGASIVAGAFVYRFLKRELRRENERLKVAALAETRERELLTTKLRQQEAELIKDELDRRLLEQRLEAATFQKRADEAEKTTLEIKSQLYASIGIMAGSYAHNIKNLLVRPNDLLSRCLEAPDLHPKHGTMLNEVRSTLGTVTERLQQILKTVRRDSGNPELTVVDVADLTRSMGTTWADMAREKWKIVLATQQPDEPLPIQGDLSHLQQAIENLLFNARDATFEMRNHLRELARTSPPEQRKEKLLHAASWKGEITIRARREPREIVFDVTDNGIGMTEEVRENCLNTHFTTKRDNALYEGYSAGMGLGLSFVAMVFEHHGATLEIESQPLLGATFRVRFPLER